MRRGSLDGAVSVHSSPSPPADTAPPSEPRAPSGRVRAGSRDCAWVCLWGCLGGRCWGGLFLALWRAEPAAGRAEAQHRLRVLLALTCGGGADHIHIPPSLHIPLPPPHPSPSSSPTEPSPGPTEPPRARSLPSLRGAGRVVGRGEEPALPCPCCGAAHARAAVRRKRAVWNVPAKRAPALAQAPHDSSVSLHVCVQMPHESGHCDIMNFCGAMVRRGGGAQGPATHTVRDVLVERRAPDSRPCTRHPWPS